MIFFSNIVTIFGSNRFSIIQGFFKTINTVLNRKITYYHGLATAVIGKKNGSQRAWPYVVRNFNMKTFFI